MGHYRLDGNDEPTWVGGVKYTIKVGIVYGAAQLLKDVRAMLAEAKGGRPLSP